MQATSSSRGGFITDSEKGFDELYHHAQLMLSGSSTQKKMEIMYHLKTSKLN